ncbi:MAG: carbon storage regulator, CsrA [Planctomycetota bacterium]|nr:carbon storage regulator, CsrA [Planctomycetota bacterium]
MLVLSRKRDDVILIGDDVRITVVKIDRNHVRLGIEAPGSTSIVREELLLDAEDRAARLAWVASEA